MLRESTSLSGMKYFGSGAIVGAALTLAVPRGVTSVWIRQAPFFVLGLSPASRPITMRSKVCALASPGEVARRALLLASAGDAYRACTPTPESPRRPTNVISVQFNSVWFCDQRRDRKYPRDFTNPNQALVDRVVRRFRLGGVLLALVQDRRGLGQLLPHQPRVDAALRAQSSSCDPSSLTPPSAMTAILSAFITVDRRCATNDRRESPLRISASSDACTCVEIKCRGASPSLLAIPDLFDLRTGLHRLLRVLVERRRRLVEQDDLRPPQKDARDGHALALAPRQAAAALADARLIGVLHLRNEVVRLRLGRRGLYFFAQVLVGVGVVFIRARVAVRDVLANRPREQRRVLGHDPKQPAVRLHVQ